MGTLQMSMSVMDKTRPKPQWLIDPPAKGKSSHGHRYWNRLWNAQPAWASVKALRSIYREAARMRGYGLDVHVDHVVPLNHPFICGLHVPSNLRIIDASENLIKGNREYPDYYQMDLFKPVPYFELEMQ